MAYAFLDDIKIIDLGWPSRSVTTSTVVPALATAKLFVLSVGLKSGLKRAERWRYNGPEAAQYPPLVRFSDSVCSVVLLVVC